MPQGIPRTWYRKYRWILEHDGIARAGFKSCTDLRMGVANIDHKEGGDPVPYPMPGTVTVTEVTLSRGACNDFDLYNLFKNTIDVATGNGEVEPDLFQTFDIVQLDRDGSTVERYRLYRSYAREYSAGNWDMDADEVRMEELVIKFRYFERVESQ